MSPRSVVGLSSKRSSSPLGETRIRQGAFAPRALRRFLAHTPPSDSRPGRAAVMDSRPPWVRRHASVSDHPTGSLRFLDRSVGARRPLPPRRARPLRLLVAWRPVSGFTFSGRMATLTCVSRPNRVHARALRLTPSPSQASTARSPAPPLGRLHGERAIPMVSTFQLTRSTRLA